jgi:ABC-2 type transport system permease protein
MLILVLPVIQLTVLGFAVSSEVKNIKLAVFAQADDVMVGKIARRAFATGWFVPAEVKGTDPVEWLRSGRADVVLAAPEKGLGNDLKKGRARLQVLIDASNAVKARQIANYVSQVTGYVAAEETGYSPPDDFNFSLRVLYNPSQKSAVFLVPGVMVIVLCVVSILLTAMSLAKEKETGTFETLISAPVSTLEILLGKSIPYFLLSLVNVPIVLLAAAFVFGVPFEGSLWLLGFSAALFVFTTVSFGIFISTVAANQQQAMMGGFLFLFPGILLSGIMFPIENIPAALKWICYLDPMTYFIALVRNIMLKGGGVHSVVFNLAGLGILGCSILLLAVFRFRRKLS